MNQKINKQPSEYLKSRNESTTENITSYKSQNIGDKSSRNVTSLKNYETNAEREKYRKENKNASFVAKTKPPQTTKAGNKPNIPKTFAYDVYANQEQINLYSSKQHKPSYSHRKDSVSSRSSASNKDSVVVKSRIPIPTAVKNIGQGCRSERRNQYQPMSKINKTKE